MTENTNTQWTTDAAGGFPLDIHRPDGTLRLRVIASDDEGEQEHDARFALHVSVLLSEAFAAGKASLVFGAGEERVTCTMVGNKSEELAERIGHALAQFNEIPTEAIKAMPGNVFEMGKEIVNLDAQLSHLSKSIHEAAQSEKAWEDLRLLLLECGQIRPATH